MLACDIASNSLDDTVVTAADGEVVMDDDVDEDVGMHWLLLVSIVDGWSILH
jgi:hypothetical protein